MIVCLLEKSIDLYEFNEPYLVDTNKLTNTHLKEELEGKYKTIPTVELKGLATENGWLPEIEEELNNAYVSLPQFVENIVCVVFKSW